MPTDMLHLIFSRLEACHLLALIWTCHYLSRLILKWAPPSIKKKLPLRAAARNGPISLFQWMQPFAPSIRPNYFCREAASGGQLDILLYLGDGKLDTDPIEILQSAARRGRLNILDYWFEKEVSDVVLRRTCYDRILISAIRYNQIEVVEWVMPHCCEITKQRTWYCKEAAGRDEFEILKSLRYNNFAWCDLTYNAAIKGATLPLLRWLDEQNCPQWGSVVEMAIEHGRIETVKWLRQKGTELSPSALMWAVHGGHMEMLVHLCEEEEGLEWKYEVCGLAITLRRLDMLQYIRTQGCPWGECDDLLEAPEEIQRWSYENGCPVNELFSRIVLSQHPEWKRIV